MIPDSDMQHLSIKTNRPGVHFHLIAYNFMDKEIQLLINGLRKQTSYERKLDMNIFQTQVDNHKQLSDELVYVLDRKGRSRFTGNYLEKPRVLLNR